MRSILSLALVTIAIFLAGCIGPFIRPTVRAGTATGVVITKFEAFPSEVYSGFDSTFTVTVENIGESDAGNVQATIFGLGDWSLVSGTAKQDLGTLYGKVPEIGAAGASSIATWAFTSPANLKVDLEYTAFVRISYSYSTSATGGVRVYNPEFLKIKPEVGAELLKRPGVEYLKVASGAPVSVSLGGLARPLMWKDGGEGRVYILLSNVGQGRPYATDIADGKVTVKAVIDGKTCIDNVPVVVPPTGYTSKECKFKMKTGEGPAEFKTLTLTVDVSYNYYVDGQTTVKVLKAMG